MRQGETHVFRLVQLLRRDDSILITGQIAGEGLESDDTYVTGRCMNACRHTQGESLQEIRVKNKSASERIKLAKDSSVIPRVPMCKPNNPYLHT